MDERLVLLTERDVDINRFLLRLAVMLASSVALGQLAVDTRFLQCGDQVIGVLW